MLNLVLTTDSVSLISSSTADLEVHTSGIDYVQSPEAATPWKQNTKRTTATTGDIVAAPAASTFRNVKFLSIRNKHASASNDVTVQYNANATLYELFECTLLAGEELVCREGIWFHFDASGGVYGQQLPVASDTVVGGIEIATQGELESATDTTKAVTPGRQHFHPGVAKVWWRVTVSGGAPTLANSYNVTSIADAGLGRLTVTIATDFSGVNYAAVIGVERASTALTVANCRNPAIRNASPAAGTIEQECWDQVATTATAADPATWYGALFGDQ